MEKPIQIIRYSNDRQRAIAIGYFTERGNREDPNTEMNIDAFKSSGWQVDCIHCSDGVFMDHSYAWHEKYKPSAFHEIPLFNAINDRQNENDAVKPTHYPSAGGQDVINFCINQGLGFLEGNVVKYVTRYKGKGGKADLKKAQEYLRRLIESLD